MQKPYKFTAPDVTTFDYMLSVPDNYDKTTERLPLIVFLHGAGERGSDIKLVNTHGIPKIFAESSPYRVITLSPQCAADRIWNTQIYPLKALIDYIVSEYNIDTDRISITGISMGGYGTWEMGMSFPGFFSAMAPICGGGTSWRASLIVGCPVRAFHGALDDTVPLAQSQEMCSALKAAGGDVTLTVFPDLYHNSWDRAYGETDLVKWLAESRRV